MKTIKIKSIKKVVYDGPVYDLSFKNDPYFMAKSTSSKTLNNSRNSLIIIHNSPPDIDIDFQTGTDDITDEFLLKKYGPERTFHVGTFSTWNEKGCLKDVVRAYRGPEEAGNSSDVAYVTKEMPKDFKKEEYDLAWWFENYPTMKKCSVRVKEWLQDPKNRKILDTTLKLQGQIRGFGSHAAGVVITPGPSWEYLPTNMIVKQNSIVSAFPESDAGNKDLSMLGILKLDMLKVSTINVIMDCIDMIKEGEGIDLTDTIMHMDEHLDDENIYKELMIGQNHGIFQFESPGMNSLLRRIVVEKFDEMVAANALYRPGAMGVNAHFEYAENKHHPEKIEYPSELLRDILSISNGVLAFQEQIQFIAHKIGGMDLGEGDLFRRALEKAAKLIKKVNKNEELTEEERNSKAYKTYEEYWAKFVDGATANGVDKAELDKISKYMSEYLGYSFNLSHSLSYAYIAVQTLYLKHYYPTYFYTALLNMPKTGGGKEEEQRWLTQTITAAMIKGIDIKTPSRKSKWEWSMTGPNEITMGFSSINGMGEAAFEELQQRLRVKRKTFDTITMPAFFETSFTKFNKTSFRGLLKAGVFDDWSSSREYLMHVYEKQKKKSSKRAATANQLLVFDVDEIEYSHQQDTNQFPNTTEVERSKDFIEVCGFDMQQVHRIANINEKMIELNEKSKKEILPLTHYSEEGFYWFILENIIERETKKGKPFLQLVATDGVEYQKFNIFGSNVDTLKPILQRQSVYVGKFFKKDGWLNYNGKTKLKVVMNAFEDKLLV